MCAVWQRGGTGSKRSDWKHERTSSAGCEATKHGKSWRITGYSSTIRLWKGCRRYAQNVATGTSTAGDNQGGLLARVNWWAPALVLRADQAQRKFFTSMMLDSANSS